MERNLHDRSQMINCANQNRRDKLARKESEKTDLYKAVFNTELGKKVLDDLSNNIGMNHTGFNVESERITSYNLGKKEVMMYILNKLK